MTLDEMRARDAAWEPRCQSTVGTFLGSACGWRESGHIKTGATSFPHRYQYDPAADISPEADRRRLLEMLDNVAALLASLTQSSNPNEGS